MNAKVQKITESLLDEIANKIVEHFHPHQIILFGSYAYGEPKTDSDSPFAVEFRYPGETATVEESKDAVKVMRRVRRTLRVKLNLGDA